MPLVRIGDALGLYKTLKEIGPASADELADATGCATRYVREWLAAQAASGYVHYEGGRFSLTPEQAFVFAEPDSPVNLIGAFDTAAAMVENQPKVQSAFKTGRGVAWGDQAGCMFCAVARLFRPGYVNALVQEWLPALDGVDRQVEGGCDGGRRGVWARAVDDPDGAGVPQFPVYRLRLPSGFDCRCDRARPSARSDEPALRGRPGAGL